MPIRNIPKNYRNLTGLAASSKAVGAAQFESTLERDFLALLEFSPEVKRFEVQPVKIEWFDPPRTQRSYTPDVLVEFDENLGRCPWLYEVKYRRDLKKDWETLRPKFRRGIRFAKQKGWRFRLVTEVEIRTPYLANVRFLLPFKFRSVPDDKIAEVLGHLATYGRTTPENLKAELSSDPAIQSEYLPTFWHLLANRRIGADLDQPLTMDSPIWTPP